MSKPELCHTYEFYSPEIFRLCKAGRFSLHTLSSLGFKRSIQAEQTGYSIVKPLNSNAKIPAYWIAEQDVPVYLQCIAEIESEREQTQRNKESLNQKRKDEEEQLLNKLIKADRNVFHHEKAKNPNRSVKTILALIKKNQNIIKRFDKLILAQYPWCERLDIKLNLEIDAKESVVLITHTYTLCFERHISLITKHEINNQIKQHEWDEKLVEFQVAICHLQDVFNALSTRLTQDADSFLHKSILDALNSISPGEFCLDRFKTKLQKNLHTFSTFNDITKPLSALVKDGVTLTTQTPGKTDKVGLFAHIPLGGNTVILTEITPILFTTTLDLDTSLSVIDAAAKEIERLIQYYSSAFERSAEKLKNELSTHDLLHNEISVSDYYCSKLPSQISGKMFETSLRQAEEETRNHYALLGSMKDLLLKFGRHWILSRYTHARAMQREIIIFAGPTNSGKTYRAFEEAYKGQTITYLAPLRLLAMEGYDRFLKDGKSAYLLTGEERIGSKDAPCVASTIEMCNIHRRYDCAIIDEAQMLTDPERGAAWTAALLGVVANKVILTCPESAVPLLKKLFALTQEPVTVITLERKAPLTIRDTPYTLNDITPQSAVIAFSRKAILAYKELFESRKMTCAVIYGALSPEVRREQSARFSSGDAQILIATDAVSMGLNLPIQKVVFTEHMKFNGIKEEKLSRALTQQIAGRAGRYGIVEGGEAAALSKDAHKHLLACFDKVPTFTLNAFFISLDPMMVEMIAKSINSLSLVEIYAHFTKMVSETDKDFIAYATEQQQQMFHYLDREKHHTISLANRFTLSCAPVNKVNYTYWTDAVKAVNNNVPLLLKSKDRNNDNVTQKTFNERSLQELENEVSRLSLYRWLHYHFESAFPDLDVATYSLSELNRLINLALTKKIKKLCISCGKPIPLQIHHKRCDTCFNELRASRYDDFYE